MNFVAAFRNRLPAKTASLPGHQLDLSPVLNTSTKEVLILNPNFFLRKCYSRNQTFSQRC